MVFSSGPLLPPNVNCSVVNRQASTLPTPNWDPPEEEKAEVRRELWAPSFRGSFGSLNQLVGLRYE